MAAWKEKLAEKWWGLKIAERAEGLSSIMKVREANQRLVRKTQDGTLGQATPDAASPEERGSESMGVSVGDTTSTTHNYPPPPQSSLLDKVVLLVSAGAIGGAMLLGPFAWDLLRPKPPVIEKPVEKPVQMPAATKTQTAEDSWMEYRLKPPKKE